LRIARFFACDSTQISCYVLVLVVKCLVVYSSAVDSMERLVYEMFCYVSTGLTHSITHPLIKSVILVQITDWQ